MKMTKIIKFNNNKTFHESLKYLVSVSQYFGLFPINGILSDSYRNLSFSWCSTKTFYSLLVSFAAVFEGLWCAYFTITTKETFQLYELNVVVFYTRGTLTCLAFLDLAKHWPSLMEDFESIEKFLRNYPSSEFVYMKLKILTYGIFFAAAVEHFSIQAMNLIKSIMCERTIWEALHRFFAYISYRQIFAYVPYNLCLGIFLQILNFYITFGWTFIDIFIVHASTNFAQKLVQLRNQISLTVTKHIESREVWNTLRQNYTDMLYVFFNFNKQLNNIILVSFASNIFFLLTQLFSWMRVNSDREATLHHVYFGFSISLLISRTALVCYYGASIKEESALIKNTLVTIPSSLYNDEIERFIVEVNSSPMILSGNKYFFITRSLILKIAASIVTYELVMIQFTDEISKKTGGSEC